MNRPSATAIAIGLALLASGGGCAAEPGADPSPGLTASLAAAGGSTTTSSTATSSATDPTATTGASSPGNCISSSAQPPRTGTLTPEASQVAEMLYAAALACAPEYLINKATEDETKLSFGDVSPQGAFAVPEPGADTGFVNRYEALVRLLALPPAEDNSGGETTFVWPRVHTRAGAEQDAAWQEAVDAGLIDASDVEQMRSGSGYLGYRTGITSAGQWQFMIAGD